MQSAFAQQPLKVQKIFLAMLLLTLLSANHADAQGDQVARVLALINQARLNAGLTPLAMNAQLTAAAQAHADDLSRAGANYAALGHNGSDGSTPLDRIKRAGYPSYSWGSLWGENWAAYQTVDISVDFWMKDPPHRNNILRPTFREIGIGAATTPNGFGTIVITDFGAEPNVLPVFINGNGKNVTLLLSNENVTPDGDGPNVIGQAVNVDIATSADFSNAVSQPFARQIPYSYPKGNIGTPLYVRFGDAQGRSVVTLASGTNLVVAPAALLAATDTPLPTATFTPTARPQPTRTFTPRPTRTPTRTLTKATSSARTKVAQARTPTSSVSERTPTPSLTPTDVSTPTEALATLQPVATAAPGETNLSADAASEVPMWAGGLFALAFGVVLLALFSVRLGRIG